MSIGWLLFITLAIITAGPIIYMIEPISSYLDRSRFGNKLAALWLTFAGINIASWPAWLFFLLRAFLAPVGFWQNLLLTGLGVYCLGFLQLLMWALFAGFFIEVIAEDLFD